MKVSEFLKKSYDSLVHGAYETAMELYTGRTNRFMMTGQESDRHVCMSKVSVAGKLLEVIGTLELVAIVFGLRELATEIMSERHRLDDSDEQPGADCPR